MIRITRKALFPEPTILQTAGHAARNLLEQAYDQGVRVFQFDKDIYAAGEVKETLIAIQNYKCCFCESKIGHIDDGDVEHLTITISLRRTPCLFIQNGKILRCI